ncbi:MAG: AAA family ATPase [Syntrophothermus sp.]
MSYHIAVAGKGGTGKTTFSAMLIKYLLNKGRRPILAVDADPNANLGEALGVEPETTIADLIAETQDRLEPLPGGMAKETYIEYRLQAALAESKDVDLLVMGGPEGAGCYCYPNNLLRKYMERLHTNYPYVVMDNEAGLEHLSRRTTNDVDLLIVVSDPTVRGVRSAGRINELVDGIKLNVKRRFLIVSKATGEPEGALAEEISKTGLPLAGILPLDPAVTEYDFNGRPLIELPGDAPVAKAVTQILDQILV